MGITADGEISFTKRFRKGQVLFGKRRAYQRKVAVAEFDGICSSDILTFEPKGDDLLPELLAFFVQSEGFFEHALGTSSGSLSPRTRCSQLQDYEFPLPPKDEQRRIAEILWATDEAFECVQSSLKDMLQFREKYTEAALEDRLEDENSGSKNGQTAWPQEYLAEHVDLASGQVDPREEPYCDMVLVLPPRQEQDEIMERIVEVDNGVALIRTHLERLRQLKHAYPQCRILADAFHGSEATSKPDDQEDIRLPMPVAIDRSLDFVMRNTRHPMRVVGLNRIKLDEYPVEALREALVNAVAHRRYEQDGQKILLRVFSDRVTISSPGLLPSPLRLTDVRKGKYHPCSRNPSIAQGLSFFHRIEERGSGFGRMRDEMLNHGLDRPVLGTQDGYFEVTFYGPGDDLERLKVPAVSIGSLISPSVESQLNDRQKEIVQHVIESGSVTSGWCRDTQGVTYDTANRDLKSLMELKVLRRLGEGRSTKYVLWEGVDPSA